MEALAYNLLHRWAAALKMAQENGSTKNVRPLKARGATE